MLTAKENSLLKDLMAQEKLCIGKYAKYAAEANDPALKDLFTQIGGTESQHLQTLEQVAAGVIPQTGGGGQQAQPQSQQAPGMMSSCTCTPEQKKEDAFLCQDALAMEKAVSGTYNTSIFEFSDPAIRETLNHIQKEEQQHGEKIYQYMAANGMYQ